MPQLPFLPASFLSPSRGGGFAPDSRAASNKSDNRSGNRNGDKSGKRRVYLIFSPDLSAASAVRDYPFLLRVFRKLSPADEFAHVAVAVRRGSFWALLDPLLDGIDLLPLSGGERLIALLNARGCRVCELILPLPAPSRVLSFFEFFCTYHIFPFRANCVELVKAVIKVRAWWVFTPRQLFCFLEKQGQILKESKPNPSQAKKSRTKRSQIEYPQTQTPTRS